jgi:hypothetical protein
MMIFAIFLSLSTRLYANPQCQKDYRVNINSLFDRENRFLYENQHFLALIRRIHNKYNHLINPAFEIDPEILVKNEIIDKRFEEEDK